MCEKLLNKTKENLGKLLNIRMTQLKLAVFFFNVLDNSSSAETFVTPLDFE